MCTKYIRFGNVFRKRYSACGNFSGVSYPQTYIPLFIVFWLHFYYIFLKSLFNLLNKKYLLLKKYYFNCLFYNYNFMVDICIVWLFIIYLLILHYVLNYIYYVKNYQNHVKTSYGKFTFQLIYMRIKEMYEFMYYCEIFRYMYNKLFFYLFIFFSKAKLL